VLAVADVVLDSDIVIWHLRGREAIVHHVLALADEHRLGISAITRTEVIAGMRDAERGATLGFLDACELLPVTAAVADRAGEAIRVLSARGITRHVPDALIAATALEDGAALHTCNPRHYESDDELEVVRVQA